MRASVRSWREYPSPGFMQGNCTGSTPYSPTCPCPGITRPDGAPPCRRPPTPSATRSNARIGNWSVLNIAGNQDRVVAALSHFGPMAIGVNATCLETYAGGIIDGCASTGGIDHAVLLVGAGKTAAGTKYWVVKNSWGLGFGEAGYFRMERNTGQLAFTQAFPACYAAGCTMDGWEQRWQRQQMAEPPTATAQVAEPATTTLRAPAGIGLRSTGSTGYSLSVSTVYEQPILPSVAVSAGASVVRLGEEYHLVVPDAGGKSVAHWAGTANASLPWKRVGTLALGVQSSNVTALSLYWNSGQTRWELLLRAADGHGASWVRMHSRTAGFDALASGSSWVTDASGTLRSSGVSSSPFYDAAEGRWHRLLAAPSNLELASSDQIAGPYERASSNVPLPAWVAPAAGAAVCPWSGDATHFAVFAAANRSRFGFCLSWDALEWPSAPPQQVELPLTGWAKEVTSVHGIIEDPVKHGTFSVFFSGLDAGGKSALGVMQVLASYSGGGTKAHPLKTEDAAARWSTLARRPPMGWRSWNAMGGSVTQADIQANVDLLVSTGLAATGYASAGIDEGWEACGQGVNGTQHDAEGRPVVKLDRFPNISALVAHARRQGISMGWYLNGCACGERTELAQNYAGDIASLHEFGFSSVKFDGCGAMNNVSSARKTSYQHVASRSTA